MEEVQERTLIERVNTPSFRVYLARRQRRFREARSSALVWAGELDALLARPERVLEDEESRSHDDAVSHIVRRWIAGTAP